MNRFFRIVSSFFLAFVFAFGSYAAINNGLRVFSGIQGETLTTPAFAEENTSEGLAVASNSISEPDIIVCENGVLDEMPGRLHQKVFNASVNVGTNRGIKLLQQSANKISKTPSISVDGAIGPRTRNKLCGLSQAALIDEYCKQQAAFYRGIVARSPSQGKFLKGWLNRAAWKPE